MTRINAHGVKKKDSFFGPFVASIPAFVTQVLAGVLEGHAAVLLPQLNDASSPVSISTDDAPWIVSLGFVLTPFIAVIRKPLMDTFGRKCNLYLFFVLSTFGFLSVSVASAPAHLYLGRVISSAAYGLSPDSFVYVSEICADGQRSSFLFFLSLMRPVGLLMVYSLSNILEWGICSMVFVVTSHIGLLFVFHVPQSPVWLVQQSRLEEAATSLKWLRSDHDVIDKEIAAMKISTPDEEFQQRSGLAAFFNPSIFKPLAALVAYSVLQHATGLLVVLSFALDFFGSLSSPFNPAYVIVCIAFYRIFLTAFWVYLSSKFDKVFLTTTAAFGAGCLVLSVCVMQVAYPDVVGRNESLQLLQLSLCASYTLIGGGIDFHNLPVDLRTVFPPDVLGTVRGFVKFLGGMFLFLSMLSYPFLVRVFGLSWVLFFFGISCFSFGLLVKSLLPKFKGKTRTDDTEGTHSTRLQLTTYL
nr:PREDICTED: sugar transporter ERD6-like 1 isoform X2 [Bemisia tabaci]